MDNYVSLYARVSSSKQAREKTIDSQIASLLDRINKDGNKILNDYIFADDGYSGSVLLRPGLERLRDAISNRMIQKVYIHSADRLARKYAYQFLLIDEF